jgi:hypothetical protein
MEPRESRLAKNEAIFRDVNERVVVINEELGPDPRAADLVDGLICECSEPGCLERVGPLRTGQYEAVPNDPRLFMIAANHQAREVERVIDENAGYWIVEKLEGVLADVARERDPRN